MILEGVVVIVLLLVALKIFGKRFVSKRNLNGLSVLVTGAGSGFGAAVTSALLKRNVQVFALDINVSPLEKLYKDSPYLKNESLVIIPCDVTKQEQIDSAYQIVASKISNKKNHKYLFGLINNAGIISAPNSLIDTTPEALFKVIDVNTLAYHRMSRTFFPLLSHKFAKDSFAQGHAASFSSIIINVSSVAGLLANPFMGPYNMSKFAVEAFSDTLRRELQKTGIHVCCIEPFFAQTGIIAGVPEKARTLTHTLDVWKTHLESSVGTLEKLNLMTAEHISDDMIETLELKENPLLLVFRPTRILVIRHLKYRLPLLLALYLPSWFVDFATQFKLL